MTDIAVGKALWIDLVRQVAAYTRNFRDAKDLLHTDHLKRARDRGRTPVDKFAAVPMRTPIKANIEAAFEARLNIDLGNAAVFEAANAIWKRASSFPANSRSDKIHLRPPKSVEKETSELSN